MTTAIYALIDPNSFRVHYVGQSINPLTRLEQHVADIGPSKRAQWIRELTTTGQLPMMKILEVVTDSQADECEQRWIDEMQRQGEPLTNVRGVKDNIVLPHKRTNSKPRPPKKGWWPVRQCTIERWATANKELD